MAKINETPEWVPEIYRLTTEADVLGYNAEDKSDGPANVQAEQLANRTAYLKEQLEIYQGLFNALIAASVAEGLAKTKSGEFFGVPQGMESPISFIFYLNDNGVAVQKAALVGAAEVEEISQRFIRKNRSGFLNGFVGPNDEGLLAFSDADGRPFFWHGGDIVARIEALERGSEPITLGSDAFGDSHVAGTGGTPFIQQLATMIGNGFIANNYGIGGQKSGQVAMRLGAKLINLSVEGDVIPISGQSVSITQINGVSSTASPPYPFMDVRFLSTNSNNTTYILDGFISGIKCRVTRTASGPNSSAKIEVYTLTALEGSGGRCLPGSLFIPEYTLQNNTDRELWLCVGINDFREGAQSSSDYNDDINAVKENIDLMVNFAERTRRKTLIFGLTNGNYANEFKGGIRYPKILELNAYLSQKYPASYIRGDNLLDVREALVSSYDSSSSQDVIDFDRDIIPSSLRADNRHPNTAGYHIYAELGFQFRNRLER